jgi:hypothetical protein
MVRTWDRLTFLTVIGLAVPGRPMVAVTSRGVV